MFDSSTSVLMLTTQFSTHFMSWSVGDPANPSYIPSGLTGFTQSMTFYQRLVNTLATFMFWVVRLVLVIFTLHTFYLQGHLRSPKSPTDGRGGVSR